MHETDVPGRSVEIIAVYHENHLSIYLSIYGPIALCWALAALHFLNPIRSWQDSLHGGSACRKAATCTKNNTKTYIHASTGIGTHDPSVRTGEDGSCLRPRVHRDRLMRIMRNINSVFAEFNVF
jgi:hypothetical protein